MAVGVGDGRRDRLLAQHVLAGIGGPFDPLAVHPVRQRDVDRLDVGMVEHVVVGAGGEVVPGLGDRAAERGGGDESGPVGGVDRRHDGSGGHHRPGADHADADAGGRRRPSHDLDQLAAVGAGSMAGLEHGDDVA